MLFIERDINKVISNWSIPAVMFTSLYPLAVILMAPLIASIWQYLAALNKEPSIPSKFALGLLFASLGFICFMIAANITKHNSDSHLPIVYILLGNLLLGTGEICLMPAMFSAISKLAPPNLQSTLMGTWFLFIAFGGYLSSLIAKLSSHHLSKKLVSNHAVSSALYSHAFLQVGAMMFMICLILLSFRSWIKNLMAC